MESIDRLFEFYTAGSLYGVACELEVPHHIREALKIDPARYQGEVLKAIAAITGSEGFEVPVPDAQAMEQATLLESAIFHWGTMHGYLAGRYLQLEAHLREQESHLREQEPHLRELESRSE